MFDIYTLEEVARHNSADDLWIIIHGSVYDLTSFLKEHPGGEEVLLDLAGQDGTICFDNIGHSNEAKLLREKFKIGELIEGDGGTTDNQSSTRKKDEASRGTTSFYLTFVHFSSHKFPPRIIYIGVIIFIIRNI